MTNRTTVHLRKKTPEEIEIQRVNAQKWAEYQAEPDVKEAAKKTANSKASSAPTPASK